MKRFGVGWLPGTETATEVARSFVLLRDARADPLTWLWLLVGLALLPFTKVQTMLPLAAWLAPVFLLRFARTCRRAAVAVPMIFLVQAIGGVIATRGADSSDRVTMAVGMLQLLFVALLDTLPYAADRLIGPPMALPARALLFPCAFTTVDWLTTRAALLNGTGSTVYSQDHGLALLQIVSVTGMWGIAFLIGWCATTVNALWEHGPDRREACRLVFAFATVLFSVIMFGGIRLNFAAPSSPTVLAATITRDHATFAKALRPPFDWLTFNRASEAERTALRPRFDAMLDVMLARSETALRAGARIIGWQEGAALVLEDDRAQAVTRAAALAQQYSAVMQIALGVLVSAPTHHFYRNQSILIDGSGRILATYQKTYPVVFGEAYVAIAGSGELPVVNTMFGRMATAICNDFHFPTLIRQAGRQDAEIMMAPYDDITPWGEQDATVAIFRAVENGYSMVRAAGNGMSMIADYQGRVFGQRAYDGEGGVMLAWVPKHGTVTVYSRIGDTFAYLCVLGLILLTGLAVARR